MEINKLINIKKTIIEYGYNPENLKPSSEKNVFWSCSICKEEVSKKFRYANKNSYCLKCSNKINASINKEVRIGKLLKWHSENEHPLKGKERPEHIKEILKKGREKSIENSQLPENRLKKSIEFSGEGNPFYGKTHSQYSIQKMSMKQKEIARRGKYCNFYGKKYWPKRGKELIYNDIRFRSNWELLTAKYFDNNNIKWEYEPKYFILDDDMTYTPDFYLKDLNKWIEVKGYWYEDAISKYDIFRIKFSETEIEVWDEIKLKEYNIL